MADARHIPLADESVQCCVTSPPYWGLRDYGTPGQLGLCKTPEEYVSNMVAVFREVRRVLKKDGVLWLNLGDSYTAGAGSRNGLNSSGLKRNVVDEDTRRRCCEDNKVYRGMKLHGLSTGLKSKDLVGIPWRVAFALQADGWYLRSDIIWSKPNPMPESVTDRPTKAHEYIFLMSKSAKYYYDADGIREPNTIGTITRLAAGPVQAKSSQPKNKLCRADGGDKPYSIAAGRNRHTVWSIATQPYSGSHFATFPEEIPRLCILAGSRPGDVILDPFGGSGTTSKVALELGRKPVHIDLTYHELARKRMTTTPAMAGLMGGPG